MGGGCS